MEKTLEKKLRVEIKKRGGKAYKWVSPGCNGVPDRIVIVKGLVYFVEMKDVKGKLSKLQELEMRDLKKLGMNVKVIKNEEQLVLFLEEVDCGIQAS